MEGEKVFLSQSKGLLCRSEEDWGQSEGKDLAPSSGMDTQLLAAQTQVVCPLEIFHATLGEVEESFSQAMALRKCSSSRLE